ncbi:hypothetical protein NDU88_010154 [Pleurodeles waltl]|uniref:Uncharacterized protein n=1 Tax=Pleurodeles waltl TaxID=8319 RepID=A0AAV7PXF5_PLEWA|nr:hypothetical protein NDU88_010154 [Pleurodeles waltl]
MLSLFFSPTGAWRAAVQRPYSERWFSSRALSTDCVSPIPKKPKDDSRAPPRPRVLQRGSRGNPHPSGKGCMPGSSDAGNPRCSTAALSDGGGSSGLVLGSGGRGFRASPLRRHHPAYSIKVKVG